MDDNSNKLETLIKIAPYIGIAICILVFIALSQIPPSGPWVKDATVPVFPTLKYKHMDEPWGQNYKREDGQPTYNAAEALNPANQPVAPAKSDAISSSHSSGLTPRLLSFRDSVNDPSLRQQNSVLAPQAPASAPVKENNISPVQDLLSAGYINDSQTPYESAFGTGHGDATNTR